MITATGITTENQIKTDLDLNTADLSAYKWTWIDFENPTTEEVQHLKDTFHFHPLAIEKILDFAVSGKHFTENDVFFYNERWHCFDVHSDCSNSNKEDFYV